ncbi:unnamed protein product [Clavelina lepadiformis]|uniref:Fibrinogen C-terminal domain-containing protein n=1 Tax=Clavelina lepadiformis TaxID=159417 RepID=A0ABP0GVG9_CLALP
MHAILCILLTACLHLTFSQECRQIITVCDESATGTGTRKGDKGDVGAPGKSGNKGSKGDVGPIGLQGASCSLGSLGSELLDKLAELESRIAPSSCSTSARSGRVVLSSGEEAVCDEGWTVFQRRLDGSVDFNQNWNMYRRGFGNMNGEFWLGLDRIYGLTKYKGCRLKIDLWDFEDNYAYAEYSSFSVADELNGFRLHVSGYNGTAGDSMGENGASNDGMQFSTKDRDQDVWSGGNCAVHTNGPFGGWWFRECGYSLLNSGWGRSTGTWSNIIWYHWKGDKEALKATTMKLRCD